MTQAFTSLTPYYVNLIYPSIEHVFVCTRGGVLDPGTQQFGECVRACVRASARACVLVCEVMRIVNTQNERQKEKQIRQLDVFDRYKN